MEGDGSLKGIKNRHCPLLKKKKKKQISIENKKQLLIENVFLRLLGQ